MRVPANYLQNAEDIILGQLMGVGRGPSDAAQTSSRSLAHSFSSEDGDVAGRQGTQATQAPAAGGRAEALVVQLISPTWSLG